MTTLARALRTTADARDRAALYRAWHAAQRIGAPPRLALEGIAGAVGTGATERLRDYLAGATTRGDTLTATIGQAPIGLVDDFERARLAVGEETGTLERAFQLLAEWYQAHHRFLAGIWRRSTYPLIVTLAAAV
ncbi:MAG TPA: type II secretion system F family protein, partial [Gemmatimonadaceae bacterium]|nr:type II secretion system F family protein [Gemmatimonadaceae bacterium]